MKNVGKVFENDFKQSVPQEYCLLHRLPDPPQSFKRSKDTKFSHKNPCDFHMFDSLSDKLREIISKTGNQELTQDNMQEALREIRRALLEADVNLRVVKSFKFFVVITMVCLLKKKQKKD